MAVAGTVLLAGLYLLPSAATADRFEPGSVQARAQSLRTGGFIGGTEATVSLGRAIARAQGQQGNAQAQAVDMGLFGLLFSQPNGCTGTAPLPPERVPRPLYANSVKGDRSDTKTTADGQIISGGKEYAAATTKPSASARTDIGDLELPGVVSLDGLHSVADASITAASARRDSEASSTVDAIDIAGIVRLEGVRWTTTKSTGHDAKASGTFTVGRITMSGAPLPTETPAELADSFEAIGSVLGPLGVTLRPPSVLTKKDGTIEVTPLTIVFGGNDQANPVLGPALRQLQPLRDQLYALSQEGGCPVDTSTINAALLVVDLALAGVSGSGGLILEVGGVRTLHDTRTFESPLGDLPPLVAPTPAAPPAVVERTPTITRVPGSDRVEAQPGSTGRVSTRCATTHPSGSPGCSDGRAALAGALGLLVVAGLFGADVYRSRRASASEAGS